ncbi:MAG: type II toxin-antitoxin system VapC family toxin [Anaerolineales bacterium]|nr:type II toxin-antitoxin system VapC family toxin [Anaerolineales bacterium]MCA9948948.1 type II toxin-antitoxin system VapC family toxin [Anaerolineales bacterium]
MKALLDTHTFLWWITDDGRLSKRVRDILSNGRNTIYFSAASGWEIAIKARLNKLTLPTDIANFVGEHLTKNAFEILPIQLHHTLHVYALPAHHRDPFDHILIAQGQLENLPLLTIDAHIAQYDIKTIWN